MKTKLHFKLIGLLISISLVALIGFQSYWLMGLYDSLRIQLDKDVQEAMLHADYKDLFTRMRRLKEKQKLEQLASIHLSYEDDDDFSSDVSIEDTSEPMNTVQVGFNNEFDDEFSDEFKTTNPFEADSALIKYMRTVQQIQNMILQGLHSFTDTLESVYFNEYDSLLVSELKARGIHADYQIYSVQVVSPEHTIFQTLSKSHPHAEIDTTSAPFDWSNAVYYDYPIFFHLDKPADTDIDSSDETTLGSPQFYRLYLKNPTAILLRQMGGILFSSFLLLILIIIAFVYLLRTILRQKTVEELKTDFTNNMTHELKTPISVSYAAVDALLNFGNPTDEKQQRYLSIVKEQLTHLTGLVEQILTLSVENRDTFRLHPEPVFLHKLVDSLIEQHRLKSQKQVEFNIDIPSGLRITTDRTHLYNMLNNLIDNAIKYSDKEVCRIQIAALKENAHYKIRIEDNGPGISQTHQNYIFEKFYRIPSGNLHNVKGHGLGLFYVRHIMEKQRGTVQLDSSSGKGSLFTLIFPA